MINFLISTGVILIYFVSAYGWGGLATRYIYTHSTHSVAYEVSLGLAIWVFIGGLLNALGLAYTIALDTIIILGILLFGILVIKIGQEKKTVKPRSLERTRSIPDENRIGKILAEAVPFVIIFSYVSLLIITILPADAFNFHDDFYKYFPRLSRMLQTGRLGGTPFDYIGLDSLGAHSFLQSFVAAHFPLQYINGFDAIFCFLLSGLLLNDIGRRAELPWFLRSSAITAFIVINPQYVNVSALYSGSLMILALIYSSLLFGDCVEQAEQKEILWASISFALIASTLAALKNTIAPFAVLYFIVFLMLQIIISRSRKSMALTSGITAAAAVIMLTPWFWSVFDKIVLFFHLSIRKINPENMSLAHSDVNSHVLSKLIKLFSSQRLYYGGNVSDYSFIVICTLVVAFLAGYLLLKKKEKVNAGNLIIVASAGISMAITYLINAYFAGTFNVGIRYTCPVIIAALPAIILLFAGNPTVRRPVSINHIIRAHIFSVLLILGISIGLFMNGWFVRSNQMFKLRSMISFPISKPYIDYNKYTLSESAREAVQSMQIRAEEKATILTWFEHPFLLDFERNRVFTVFSPAMLLDVGGFTKNDLQDAGLLRNYFKNIGVRYVIWGYNEVKKAKYGGTSELEKGLKALQRQNRIIFDDGRRMMIDIWNPGGFVDRK